MLFQPNDQTLWDALWHEAKRSAFHLETRDSYSVANENERLNAFLNNEPPPDPRTPWQDLMRETSGRGVALTRVRVVTVPLSDYQRWLLSVTHHNVNAGEDIRYVPRHLAGEVPQDDWWMFDTERVVYNLWDAEGRPVGMAITTDPRIVAYCDSVRQRLWELATPAAVFTDSVRIGQ
ncbi:DUF6879 family protein [Nocardia heshunensis]